MGYANITEIVPTRRVSAQKNVKNSPNCRPNAEM